MRSCLPLVVTDAERDRAARILLGDDQWAAVLANSPSRFQQAQRAPRDPPSKGIGHAVETTQPEGILGSVRGYGEE